MKNLPFRNFLFIVFFFSFFNVWAQDSSQEKVKKQTVFSVINSLETPAVELKSDIEGFCENRRMRDYQEAVFSVKTNKKSKEIHWTESAEIRQRGKFRARTCDIPPMKIKFSKKDLKSQGLKKANELKLVLSCQTGDYYAEQLIMREYLIYKLYNLLTDYSLKAKIIDLRLIDSKKGKKTPWQPSFLIEDEEEFAKRLDVEVLDTNGLPYTKYVSLDYTRFQVFQYMIGNTDWIPTTGHNIQIIQTEDGKLIPVPYDFDFSGIVEAPYACPNSWTPLKSVKERFFMGNNKSEEELNTVFEEFRQKREAMIDLIRDFDNLEKPQRKAMIAYINSFFAVINNPIEVKKQFLEKEEFLSDRY